jgi:Uma2 family endonuclease
LLNSASTRDPKRCGIPTSSSIAPVLLIEVLSPSSRGIDLRDKAAEYLQLPNLGAYLLLSQEEAKAWLWARAGDAFPPTPSEIHGLDKVIRLEMPTLALPLDVIYTRVVGSQPQKR